MIVQSVQPSFSHADVCFKFVLPPFLKAKQSSLPQLQLIIAQDAVLPAVGEPAVCACVLVARAPSPPADS